MKYFLILIAAFFSLSANASDWDDIQKRAEADARNLGNTIAQAYGKAVHKAENDRFVKQVTNTAVTVGAAIGAVKGIGTVMAVARATPVVAMGVGGALGTVAGSAVTGAVVVGVVGYLAANMIVNNREY
jgi:uncharacterized membrane protein